MVTLELNAFVALSEIYVRRHKFDVGALPRMVIRREAEIR
jgi:hypothetical protein